MLVTIRMRSEIRQGCPATGSVFGLAIGPVLRGITRTSPSPYNRLVAIAGGIAEYLHRFVDMVSQTWTQFLSLWAEDLARAREELVSRHPQGPEVDVVDHFVHLGVDVALGSRDNRWHRAFWNGRRPWGSQGEVL